MRLPWRRGRAFRFSIASSRSASRQLASYRWNVGKPSGRVLVEERTRTWPQPRGGHLLGVQGHPGFCRFLADSGDILVDNGRHLGPNAIQVRAEFGAQGDTSRGDFGSPGGSARPSCAQEATLGIGDRTAGRPGFCVGRRPHPRESRRVNALGGGDSRGAARQDHGAQSRCRPSQTSTGWALMANRMKIPKPSRYLPGGTSAWIGAVGVLWSGWADLNRRPPGPEPGALPSWATPRNAR